MNTESEEIADMINGCSVMASTNSINRILDILEKMNKRMDKIERSQQQTANIASRLANGIQPD